jgi:MoxR-like ATPase
MSNSTPGPEFWNRVNALINMANEQCDTADPSEVCASAMYASARFNAFIVARTTESPEKMKLEKERALEYFTDQFRKMMAENLDDFAENLEKYIPADPQ